MSRIFYLCVGLLMANVGFAQNELEQFLSGSWELTELSGEAGEYRSDALIGNIWHFLTNDRLVMENEQGTWTMPVSIEATQLFYQGKAYPFVKTGEHSFELTDDIDDVLTTVRFQRLPEADLPTLTVKATERGGFRLDGFYYYEEETSPPTYHYYRFYENGALLEVSSGLTPADIMPYLNRAYFSNNEKVDWNVLTVTSEDNSVRTYRREVVPSFAKEENVKLVTDVKFTPKEDVISFERTSSWESSEDTFDESAELTYYATDQLAQWKGEELIEDTPGIAEQLFLVRPIPYYRVVTTRIEEMPRFPGCEGVADAAERKSCAEMKLLKFIYGNIKYPAIARENGVEGTVVVTFVIEKDGRLTDLKIVRDIGGGCGQEAMRTVEIMQEQGIRWEPGKIYGKPVRVAFNLPVKFKLEGRTRKKRRRRRG